MHNAYHTVQLHNIAIAQNTSYITIKKLIAPSTTLMHNKYLITQLCDTIQYNCTTIMNRITVQIIIIMVQQTQHYTRVQQPLQNATVQQLTHNTVILYTNTICKIQFYNRNCKIQLFYRHCIKQLFYRHCIRQLF